MRLVGKNEIPPPRSVFSAHTHLGGRVQRPLVLFLYPRVSTHELILLFYLFLSFWFHSRTWGGGAPCTPLNVRFPSLFPTTVCRPSSHLSYSSPPSSSPHRSLRSFSPPLLSSSFLVPSSHSPTPQASWDQLQPVEARVRQVLTFLQGSTIASCLMMGPRNYNPGGQPSL